MARSPVRVFPSADAIGAHLAERLLAGIEHARVGRNRFLLGCPTGRTPRPVYGAMARLLAKNPQDISHLVLVMMDEYLAKVGAGFEYAPATEPWSCHHFARAEIVDRLNADLPQAYRLREESVWFPDPRSPAAYDVKITEAGGIDMFILASGASDGHVAFNPPGSARESRTRVIPLSEETRRDNLQTFPAFGVLANVPSHGISVGIDTIATAKASVMIVWGAGKRLTLRRMVNASHYDSAWPATVIHEFEAGEIFADADAAGSLDVS